jgi:hypothetical protein
MLSDAALLAKLLFGCVSVVIDSISVIKIYFLGLCNCALCLLRSGLARTVLIHRL